MKVKTQVVMHVGISEAEAEVFCGGELNIVSMDTYIFSTNLRKVVQMLGPIIIP
jgi:hypothetical protein